MKTEKEVYGAKCSAIEEAIRMALRKRGKSRLHNKTVDLGQPDHQTEIEKVWVNEFYDLNMKRQKKVLNKIIDEMGDDK